MIVSWFCFVLLWFCEFCFLVSVWAVLVVRVALCVGLHTVCFALLFRYLLWIYVVCLRQMLASLLVWVWYLVVCLVVLCYLGLFVSCFGSLILRVYLVAFVFVCICDFVLMVVVVGFLVAFVWGVLLTQLVLIVLLCCFVCGLVLLFCVVQIVGFLAVVCLFGCFSDSWFL